MLQTYTHKSKIAALKLATMALDHYSNIPLLYSVIEGQHEDLGWINILLGPTIFGIQTSE